MLFSYRTKSSVFLPRSNNSTLQTQLNSIFSYDWKRLFISKHSLIVIRPIFELVGCIEIERMYNNNLIHSQVSDLFFYWYSREISCIGLSSQDSVNRFVIRSRVWRSFYIRTKRYICKCLIPVIWLHLHIFSQLRSQ